MFIDEKIEASNALRNPELYEGDIFLPNGTNLNAIANDNQRWPNRMIPIAIDRSLGKTHYREFNFIIQLKNDS